MGMRSTKTVHIPLTGFEVRELGRRTRSSLLIDELGDAPAGADTEVGRLIRRDLVRYYMALGMARRNIALTRSEAIFMAEHPCIPEVEVASGQVLYLLRGLDDAIQVASYDGTLSIDGEGLVDRLANLEAFELLAISDAFEQLKRRPGADPISLLKDLGIQIDEEDVSGTTQVAAPEMMAVALANAVAGETGEDAFVQTVSRPEHWDNVDHAISWKVGQIESADVAVMKDGSAVLFDLATDRWIPRSPRYVQRWLMGETLANML